MRRCVLAGLSLVSIVGCELTEIRSKHRLGNEWRHSGTQNTDRKRFTVQQGVDFKFESGVTTGLTYRRRDVDDGSGDHDDGVWFDFSFPLWRAEPRKPQLDNRVKALERRVADLTRQLERRQERGGKTLASEDSGR